jgi:hypothetical protein
MSSNGSNSGTWGPPIGQPTVSIYRAWTVLRDCLGALERGNLDGINRSVQIDLALRSEPAQLTSVAAVDLLEREIVSRGLPMVVASNAASAAFAVASGDRCGAGRVLLNTALSSLNYTPPVIEPPYNVEQI